MANHPRVNPAGWALNAPFTSAQSNALDIAHVKSPNFDEGSDHTPAANIRLTGPQGLQLMGTQRLLYASRAIVRVQPLVLGNLSGTFSYVGSGLQLRFQQTGDGGDMTIPILNLPNGALLDSVTLGVKGAVGHTAGTITATPTTLKVHTAPLLVGAPTVLGTQVDTDVTATYEADHSLAVTALAHTIDLTTLAYAASIEGETGGDFQGGFLFYSLRVSCTVSDQSEY